MNTQKIKLSQLESLLQGVADDLRGKMDAADYKEYILGMLFLKRMSDVFDQKRHDKRAQFKHLPPEIVDKLLEEKDTYGDTFFVPKRARWNESWIDEEGKTIPPIKHLKESIGAYLNKALFAIEEENSDTLSGIFKDRINFNRQVDGKSIVKNADIEKIINRFNNFPPLVNENFEFPDLLGAAYEYILKFFADEAGKKGGQFYTPGTVVRLLVLLLDLDEGMSVCDPTVGSGGMLIQSHQWVEEQGLNADNLELYGQELDAAVVALCRMNLILHNITKYRIDFGDTIGDPQCIRDGKLVTYDRMIANPPFSQNYNKAEMKYPERFSYGFLPESGKKADLMFVQHMLSVCKPNGRVVVVMPHGVLFRGGKEKEIRRLMLTGCSDDGEQQSVQADVLEGVIGLPQQLFYGTGIPACIMVFSKQKPDNLKNKVFIINADNEYKEGKKQNTLRPEDIEKIATTFKNKDEIPGYSRLVDVSEIGNEKNDYSLNIRRYVDNTPEPEPQDVHAHLQGGVPKIEILAAMLECGKKFNFTPNELVQDQSKLYSKFIISNKNDVKTIIESDDNVIATFEKMENQLADWWIGGREVFSSLSGNNKLELPAVRGQLLNSIKTHLVPMEVLDRFQVAGIFVRWWDGVKYDLKTIRQRGWDIDLINNDDYRYLLIDKYFSKEQQNIDKLQSNQVQLESDLQQLVEDSLELCEYEPEESEDGKETKLTVKLAKDQLKEQIDTLTKKDAEPFEAQQKAIGEKETEIKQTKNDLKIAEDALNVLIALKCYGIDDMEADLNAKLYQVQQELKKLNTDSLLRIAPLADKLEDSSDLTHILSSLSSLEKQTKKVQKANPSQENKDILNTIDHLKKQMKEPKKADKAYNEDVVNIKNRIYKIQDMFNNMGGQVTDEECRELILLKHYSIINGEMHDYLDNERRKLISAFDNLFDKYAVSAQQIDASRNKAMRELTDALKALHYYD